MSFGELLAWSVWDLSRPRRLAAVAAVCLCGPAFAAILRATLANFDPEMAYGLVVPVAVYSFAMILLAVLFASGAVASEMTGRTIQFLLTRPVPRWKVFLAKWAAATAVVTVAVCASCAVTAMVTHGPAGLGESRLGRDLVVIPAGVATYSSLFALLSVLSSKPWLPALIFGLGWESWVPFIPGDFQKLSVMSYLRTLSPQLEVAGRGDLADFLRQFNTDVISASAAWNTLIVVNIVSLGLAVAVFMNAEFVPKEESA